MNPKSKGSFILLPLLLCACLLLCSCGNTTDTESSSDPQTSATAADNSSPAATSGSRDNTPVVLTGSADGTVTYGNDSVTIDASHTENGYLMVSYSGSNPKVKLQITGSDEITYTYNLHDGYETFPLTSGNGSYTVGVFENMEGTSYSTLFTQTLDVTIQDEFGPYLYANQYVNFTAQSKTVAKAVELSSSANDDLEVIENVYNYIITTGKNVEAEKIADIGYVSFYYCSAVEDDGRNQETVNKFMEDYKDTPWLVINNDGWYDAKEIFPVGEPENVIFIDKNTQYDDTGALDECEMAAILVSVYGGDDLDTGLYYMIGSTGRFFEGSYVGTADNGAVIVYRCNAVNE